MTSGASTSCGCYCVEQIKKSNTTHGHLRNYGVTPEYATWIGMKDRCLNPKSNAWDSYGGRGIGIDPAWLDFDTFFKHMGRRPRGTSLDRLDNNLGYSQSNCAWRSQVDQSNNTRRNHVVELDGRRLTVSQWAKITGLMQSTIGYRLKKKWTVRESLTKPLMKNQYR
jgi:hypothetical protein